MTFENIVAKGEIAHNAQFLLSPHCFQLYLTIKLSPLEIFQVCVNMFSKLSAVELLYVRERVKSVIISSLSITKQGQDNDPSLLYNDQTVIKVTPMVPV